MSWLSLITLAALIEYFVFVLMTGQARVKYHIQAPATTGDPVFERHYRVQQNTLEQLIIFIPAIWLFAEYVGTRSAFVLGLIFLIGRALYAWGYVNEPAQRSTGAMATFAANGILVIGSLIGLLVHAL
ncbi:MAG TPA: MAPEG family protein [Candidatus Binataceae bacterium]|nr:MAPEG family protein [Candidatus Binataceae bacterium]